MKYNVTLIPGDGIGPEIADAMVKCVEATGIAFSWDRQEAGSECIEKFGTPLPDNVLQSVRKNKIAIKGPIVTPVGTGFRSVNVALRKELDLYACVRPCKLYRGVRSRYEKVDLVIVRENTEDLYAGIEFEQGKDQTETVRQLIEKLSSKKIIAGSAISIKPISEFATRRIVTYAFEYALRHKRKKVTAVHKANIMKCTDGLFLAIARDVARKYAG
ncbi:MAG: isocitrate/isopropylmalate family dehydrogenase, partial [Candidatus Omnitrophica bacterium]|nr:isocitrate/isopropylmalate family dehydrogenase [Candidatus Omnitrophota bacterium]